MRDWSSLRILIVGAARQGLATARYLARKGAAVTLNDQRPAEMLESAVQELSNLPVRWVLGEHPLALLDQTDQIIVSGGVPLSMPLLVEACQRGLPLTNDSQIFMESVPCPVTGITGSAGKTTTTTLVGRIAHAAMNGRHQPPARAWVGGNIGLPLIDHVDEISANDIVILELSSFQLELMDRSPQVAAVLNITPNHLDRHGTMEVYSSAKARILDFQSSASTAVLCLEDPGSWALQDRVKGNLVSFGWDRRPGQSQPGTYLKDGWLCLYDGQEDHRIVESTAIQLRGEHNRLNVLAAFAIAHASGFSVEAMRAGLEGFKGVEHRLELVRSYKGAKWYNDSIATAPERTIAAIRSFNEPIVLLLGGRDKNLPWQDLADLIHKRVDHVIIFGEASDLILKAIGPVKENYRPYSVEQVADLRSAVEAASRAASQGDVVLLSPACTSYDSYRDFEERGEDYRKWVNELS